MEFLKTSFNSLLENICFELLKLCFFTIPRQRYTEVTVAVLSVKQIHRLNDDTFTAYPSHKVLNDERMHVRSLAEAGYWLHQIVGESEAR